MIAGWSPDQALRAAARGFALMLEGRAVRLVATSRKSDEDTWVEVVEAAEVGEPLAAAALQIVGRDNPEEFGLIARYMGIQRRRLAA